MRTDLFLTTSGSGVDVENGTRYDSGSSCVVVQPRFVFSSRLKRTDSFATLTTTTVKISGFARQFSCSTSGFLLFHEFGIQSHSKAQKCENDAFGYPSERVSEKLPHVFTLTFDRAFNFFCDRISDEQPSDFTRSQMFNLPAQPQPERAGSCPPPV